MRNNIVIRTEGLGKRYQLGALEPYRTLRDTIAGAFRRAPCRNAHLGYHWALRDIDLGVRQGEVLGIVGRNGSGKSTLLKLLTRITRPTEGSIAVQGRIGALLEVGTGFHPELTGRENIYLNGSILGMSRVDISRRFDEIVDFAGVEEYLDTPVKRYSSGMNVRLAFAVAAHLEPELLLVDEVLAVGDTEFRQRCINRMDNISTAGRTVIFVSHQLEMVQRLCQRVIWLDSGKLVADGRGAEVISRYRNSILQYSTNSFLAQRDDRSGNGDLRVQSITLLDEENEPINTAHSGQSISFSLQYKTEKTKKSILKSVKCNIEIIDQNGRMLLWLASDFVSRRMCLSAPEGNISCTMPKLQLAPGEYLLNFAITSSSSGLMDRVDQAFRFRILPSDYYGSGLSVVNGGQFLAQFTYRNSARYASPENTNKMLPDDNNA